MKYEDTTIQVPALHLLVLLGTADGWGGGGVHFVKDGRVSMWERG